jgi:hypothetical protein
MSIDKFIEYLATTVSGLAESTARLTGMTVDQSLPLHLAFSNDQPSQ